MRVWSTSIARMLERHNRDEYCPWGRDRVAGSRLSTVSDYCETQTLYLLDSQYSKNVLKDKHADVKIHVSYEVK